MREDELYDGMKQTVRVTGKVSKIIGKTVFWGMVGLTTGIFALGLIALGESKQELE
tara:strand:+ start:227 stop:394 length:168 start_codon:yes stop_codon:yes gene_type:complete